MTLSTLPRYVLQVVAAQAPSSRGGNEKQSREESVMHRHEMCERPMEMLPQEHMFDVTSVVNASSAQGFERSDQTGDVGVDATFQAVAG